MTELLMRARKRLEEGDFTCVLLTEDGREHTSRERGVKPLLELLSTKRTFGEFVAADKTVGAGAAHLYVLLGVRTLWTNIVSRSALEVLEANEITVAFGECVPYIINRRGDGPCPIETAVAEATSSEEAYGLIVEALKRLQSGGSGAKNSGDQADAVKIFKALADENRLEIIELLKSGEKCACKLLDALKIGQPTLSHHMHILCESGLVSARRDGKWTYYSLSKERMALMGELIEKYTVK